MTASAYVQTRCFAGCPPPLIATTSRTTLLAHRAATTLDRVGLHESSNWSHSAPSGVLCLERPLRWHPGAAHQSPHTRTCLLFNRRTGKRLGVIGGRCFSSVSAYSSDLFMRAAAGFQPTDIRFCISGLLCMALQYFTHRPAYSAQ